MKKILIKVCGMKNVGNIEELTSLDIDFMGLIFYKQSKRFIKHKIPQNSIKKVGVFVNENIEIIEQKIKDYHLSFIQLHGDESPEFCAALKSKNSKIIKAFRIGDDFDFNSTKKYELVCDYFLFDAKGKDYGGNGIIFNWDILNDYKGKLPFFLSGGINMDAIEKIKNLHHKKLFALDINSGFEIEAGLKDVNLISEFIKTLSQ